MLPRLFSKAPEGLPGAGLTTLGKQPLSLPTQSPRTPPYTASSETSLTQMAGQVQTVFLRENGFKTHTGVRIFITVATTKQRRPIRLKKRKKHCGKSTYHESYPLNRFLSVPYRRPMTEGVYCSTKWFLDFN